MPAKWLLSLLLISTAAHGGGGWIYSCLVGEATLVRSQVPATIPLELVPGAAEAGSHNPGWKDYAKTLSERPLQRIPPAFAFMDWDFYMATKLPRQVAAGDIPNHISARGFAFTLPTEARGQLAKYVRRTEPTLTPDAVVKKAGDLFEVLGHVRDIQMARPDVYLDYLQRLEKMVVASAVAERLRSLPPGTNPKDVERALTDKDIDGAFRKVRDSLLGKFGFKPHIDFPEFRNLSAVERYAYLRETLGISEQVLAEYFTVERAPTGYVVTQRKPLAYFRELLKSGHSFDDKTFLDTDRRGEPHSSQAHSIQMMVDALYLSERLPPDRWPQLGQVIQSLGHPEMTFAAMFPPETRAAAANGTSWMPRGRDYDYSLWFPLFDNFLGVGNCPGNLRLMHVMVPRLGYRN